MNKSNVSDINQCNLLALERCLISSSKHILEPSISRVTVERLKRRLSRGIALSRELKFSSSWVREVST